MNRTTAAHDQKAKNEANAPPSRASNKLSMSNCRTRRQRLAPTASLTAISLRRCVARASSRFAMFAHAIYRAIKAGAKGYLLKDARREELLDSIRKVNRGDTCIPQALVEKLAAGMSSEALTGRELGVLTLLARGKSNKEIGANLYISETTVKGHLRNIFTKLNVLSRTEAITVASRRGLVQL
jgi:ATP/maltotriose-dependent transcriptional regulator MalT